LGIAVTLALGSVGLGLLLAVKDRTGSLAQAGVVAGAFGFGNALGIFVQGRLIDRFGQSRVLVPAAAVCGMCLAVTVLPGLDVRYAVPTAAVLAGLAFPATISSMRVGPAGATERKVTVRNSTSIGGA
jgi:MFS family permease